MYTAFITRIKNLRKHTNADRLLVGECFGSTVVVGLDTEPEQLGVYFPTDGQLGIEYATQNNLLRGKDANGNNIGGYLDPEKRNIRALRLRGEQSDGLFMPLESLAAFTDITKLSEGETVSALNGVVICEKYIPCGNPGRRHTGGGTKLKTEPKTQYLFFAEHSDTAQLQHNLTQFKPGERVIITLKMHGCFISGTRVRMADNSLKKIEQIRTGDIVLGYDHYENKCVPSKVVKVFKNKPSSEWREIRFSRDYIRGDSRGKITCTPNHPFWSEEEGRYVCAKDLRVGARVSTLFPTVITTQFQKEVVLGQLLGDGCLRSFEGRTCEIQGSSKKEHEQYQDYLSEIMGGFYYKCACEYLSGYGTQMVRGRTSRSVELYNYLSDVVTFENHGDNKLLPGLVEKFTALSMAIFYMDDGSLSSSKYQRDRAGFAICDYSDQDADLICKCFQKFDINPVLYKDNEGYNRIRLNTKDAYKMFDLVAQYIPPVMRYKLPLEYRTRQFAIPEDDNIHYDGYCLSPQVVLSNKAIKGRYIEYDLQTTSQNYVVGLSVVHNTSQRAMNAIQETDKKQNFLQRTIARITKRPPEKIRNWGCVSGTRRTVLNTNGGRYGGNNDFRMKYHDLFNGKLQKGEEVYFEAVGYANDSTPIMSTCNNKKLEDKGFVKQYGDTTTFSYGCAPGENDIYVYRMTMTNEDGYTVEYPWSLVKLRCEQMGVKYVPEFEAFDFTTTDDLNERVGKYLGGADPIGKTHVREGVAVRIEGREKFTAFKSKNFEFKVLEGLIKDAASQPDIEEAEDVAV